MSNQSDFVSSNANLFAIIFSVFCGACLPFFVAGMFHEDKPIIRSPEAYGVKTPVQLYHDDIKPEYENMVIKDEYLAHQRFNQLVNEHLNTPAQHDFLKGGTGIWAKFALLVMIIVAQTCFTGMVDSIIQIFNGGLNRLLMWSVLNASGVMMFFVIVIASVFPCDGLTNFLVWLFYYALPLPAFIMCMVYGLNYAIEGKPVMLFMHYCLFIIIFPTVFKPATIPWFLCLFS